MKKALIITHAFPPAAGSGVIRTLKFAKYLPESGWNPIILTVKERYNEKIDLSMVSEIPAGAPVVRTAVFNLLFAYAEMKKKARIHRGADQNPQDKTTPTKRPGITGKLRETIVRLLTTPDRFAGWLAPGTLAGLSLIRKHHPDVIYSTSPAETTHLIGLVLKKISGIPWTIDLRDPWTLRYETGEKKTLRVRCEEWLEKKVMRGADAIIANNDFLRDAYLKKYGKLIGHKLHVVVNGYDSGDFDQIPAVVPRADNRFTISHVGEFYPDIRTPDNFLCALAGLIAEGKIASDKVRVNFVGGGEYVETAHFARLRENLRLKTVVRTAPHVEHRESIRQMLDSDLLLLLQPDRKNNTQIPAKAFEYLKTGRHILTLSPEGATTHLVSQFSNTIAAPPDDPVAIKAALSGLYERWNNGELKPRQPDARIELFDRRALTKQLAAIFDSIH